MSGIKLEVKGADKLLARLRKGADLSDVSKVIEMNTAELARSAIKSAPVDTGFLRRSIVPEVSAYKGAVKATAEYSPYIELGTRFMAAQPFIAPAFLTQKIKFLDDLKRLMK